MGIFSWANSKIKKIDWLDVKLIKWGMFCLGLPVGAYFSKDILPYWWVFIALCVLAHIRPWYKVFKK